MNHLLDQGKVNAVEIPRQVPRSRRASLRQILKELKEATGQSFNEFSEHTEVGYADWDRPNNTIRLYICEDYTDVSEEELSSLQCLCHWIYDATLTYTEVWTFSNDEPPQRIWTVRDEIIERSIRLTTDSEGRMCLEQEIHAVGVHAQPAIDWALNEAPEEIVAPRRCGKPKAGTVRLGLLFDRGAKRAIRLLAAAKDSTDSAIVNEAISLYLTALTRGAAAPLRGRRGESQHSQCGSGRSSYIIDSINREAMNFLKSAKGYSFSDVARAAIAYRIALEDSGNSLREVSAELVQSQSDDRAERASDLLSRELMDEFSNVVRSIALGSLATPEASAQNS